MSEKMLRAVIGLLLAAVLVMIGLVAYRKFVSPPPSFTFETRPQLNGDMAIWVEEETNARIQADVVLDFECPNSQKYIHESLPVLLSDPDINVRIYDAPDVSHPNARYMAAYAGCVAKSAPDQYIPFIKSMIDLDDYTDTSLASLAAEIIPAAKRTGYETCLTETIPAEVDASVDYIVVEQEIKVTPYSIIDGRVIVGYLNNDLFRGAIASIKRAPEDVSDER